MQPRPQWLIDWIENKVCRWVRLSCGHSDDMRDPKIGIVIGDDASVVCEKCECWVTVVGPITFREHAGLPHPEYPPEPLF